jgi:hypothetical protein
VCCQLRPGAHLAGMGASGSTASGASGPSRAAPDAEAVRSFKQYLGEKGRYFTVQDDSGNTVHVLGVIPGSAASEREARTLVEAIRPAVLYVDTPVLRVQELWAEAVSGRKWRPGPGPPDVDVRWDYGYSMSTVIHKNKCEQGVFKLLGVDSDNVWRSALAEARKVGSTVIAWPARYDKQYNNPAAVFDSFGDVGLSVYGNGGFWSTQIHLVAMVDLTDAKIVDGLSTPLGKITLPSSGYFSTTQVNAIKKDLRRAFDMFAKKNSASTVDFEGLINTQIGMFRDRASRKMEDVSNVDPRAAALQPAEAREVAEQMEHARDFFRMQMQVLASVLRGEHEPASLDPASLKGAVRPAADVLERGDTVALVSLPRVAGLLRMWDTPLEVDQGLMPRTWPGFGMQVGLPAVGVSGFAYAYYRLLFRRFPRAAGAFAGVVGVGAALVTGFSTTMGGYAPFGVGMWRALANPIAPVGSNVGKGQAK